MSSYVPVSLVSLLPPHIPFSLSIRDIGTFLDKERAREAEVAAPDQHQPPPA